MEHNPRLASIPEASATSERAKIERDNEKEEEDLGSSPLWMEDGWHLTWPIWHMLSRDERKSIAQRHGYKHIGEFEEYMSLQQAYDDSNVVSQKPYANELIYPKETKDDTIEQDSKPPAQNADEDDGDQSDDNNDRNVRLEYYRSASSEGEDLSLEELLLVGGKILILHDEILHQIFRFLPVDAYATLALVSPHWKHLTRTESVYKRLAERIYLVQSKRKSLHVQRFGCYRKMLENRPRVRAAGGCYVLKYSHIKKIQRDMWTEVPVGAILESTYYRYLYFQEDGRVLYALSSAPPHEMFKRLLKVCLRRADDRAAVWGTFQVQKNALHITAKQEWHTVKFDLSIDTVSTHGRFGTLTLERHLSSPSGCFEFWSRDLVEYDVPDPKFQFLKSKLL